MEGNKRVATARGRREHERCAKNTLNPRRQISALEQTNREGEKPWPWISLAVTGSRPGDRSRARGDTHGHDPRGWSGTRGGFGLLCPLQSAQEQKQRRPRYTASRAERYDCKRRGGAVWMDSRKQNVSIYHFVIQTKKNRQRFLYWFLHARQRAPFLPYHPHLTLRKSRVPKQAGEKKPSD